jgi:hypothetical protein
VITAANLFNRYGSALRVGDLSLEIRLRRATGFLESDRAGESSR